MLIWPAVRPAGARRRARRTELLPHGVEGTERGADGGERARCRAPDCNQDPAQGENAEESDQIEQGS